jgi:ParB-like chromosome segregation protein Spo0J
MRGEKGKASGRPAVQDLDIKLIEVSALNTRKDLEAGTEDSSLDDLANSIAERARRIQNAIRNPH